MRLAPYRTSQDVARGVVITFTDVTALKTAEQALRKEQGARAYAEGVLLTVREPVVVLASDLRILLANPAFYDAFDTTREDTEGRLIYQLGNGQWNIARLRHLLERILPEKTEMRDFKVDRLFPGLGRRRMSLNARRLGPPLGDSAYILLAFEDRTLRRPGARRASPP
jgi:PAS domain-containing protein